MAIQFRQSLLAIGCMFGLLVDPLAAASPDHIGGGQPADAADTGSGANARTPVPSDEKLTEALKDVQEVYNGELAAAKTTDAKKALAKNLLKTAGETDKAKDASARYTLRRMARDYATQVGDVEIAFGAVDGIVFTDCFRPRKILTVSLMLCDISTAGTGGERRSQIRRWRSAIA